MKICIFNYLIGYQTIPLLKSLISSLFTKGSKIDLFTVNGEQETSFERGFNVINFRKVLFNNLSPFVLLSGCLKYFIKKRYDYLIAVDPQSLFPAVFLSKLFNVKLIYLSLEIYVREDCNNMYFKNYYLQQKHLLKFCTRIIIMDHERKRLLNENANLDNFRTKFSFLPNTTLGYAKKESSDFLHERLNIDKRKKILLYPGELAAWSYAYELYECSKNMPDEYIIILHSRRKIDPSDFTKKIIKNANLRLSLNPVANHQLDALYGSAFIGLSLYKIALNGITARNLKIIGKSSGKHNQFLKMGIPVVMSDLPFFKYIEKKYKCGICIRDFRYLNDAIQLISENYDEYSENATKCFNKELRFDDAFEVFYRQII